MAKLTLDQLERHLFAAADILRGTMDAAEYRDFLLVLLFLKRVNDEFDAARDRIINEEMARGASRAEAEEEADGSDLYTANRIMYVPEEARWKRLAGAVDDVATTYLQPALDALEGQKGNEGLQGLFAHVNFNRIGGGGGTGTSAAKLADKRLSALIGHFGNLRLRGEDFEFPDVIGAAYEYLLKDFADSAGAKGGEFYTPRAVVRMMVELARPEANQHVYDPCVGSGGMLIHTKEYIEEHGGDPEDLALAGQDANNGSWVMATMNMLFHGASDFDLRIGDTLTNPLHVDKSYDVVLSNPPFSMDYSADELPEIEGRMKYGHTSEKGKADLMFLQHMLYMVEGRGGSVFTVMPHGVLFRSGAEGDIRARLIEDDLLEAVIGLPSNIFYGTGIPACVLVLRARGRKKKDRHGQVLFINADREYHSERAQNVLLPEHVEKIVSTFHDEVGDGTGVPRFARWVKRDELEKNAYNLNIRRYVDNTPPPEPQDVRAHLTGGVPKSEITADGKRELLEAYRVEITDLFAERTPDSAYVDFLPEGERPDAERLTALAEGRERELWESFDKWWTAETEQIALIAPYQDDDRTDFEKRRQLARLRADLITSFRARLLNVDLLDRYALSGAVAGWWQDARNELKALAGNGFKGVVEGWVDTVEAMLEPEPNPWTGGARKRSGAERRQAYGHKVVARIAPDFLRELADADEVKAKLDVKVKAAEEAEAARAAAAAGVTGEDGEASDEGGALDPAVAEALLSEPDLKKLKKERTAAAKEVKALEEAFYPLDGLGGALRRRKAKAAEPPAESAGQTALDVAAPEAGADEERLTPGLHKVRDALGEEAAREIVLGILRDDLASKLDGHVVRRRRELVDGYLGWERKYLVSLRDIEARREAAEQRLNGFLKELGYVG
ncbi:type I restriction-modification system subunit M [Streptomyces sp. NBC_01766]|uniref:type I restriction-modification system subunit M n=1 Tax=Streptomyces sp. NBC_01766 TaxID=2975936 RepID=UPI002DDB765D|nr:class I SAM-dependent DNA methyltransferase [Streptomyces sp. NBC_01766]WSC21387.1 type I restriction-modification system subunit M [Streptomyces sp. NBC_01766]